MARDRFLARIQDTGGFALAMAVFAIVLLAAIVASGYFSATQEYQIGRSMRSLTSSFYAGEAGVGQVIASWDPATFGALAIGDTLQLGPTQVSGGGEYSVIVVRTGAPADSVKRYFYIEATGRPGPGKQGERRQAAMVSAWFPDICCTAAVKTIGTITFPSGSGSKPEIEGYDVTPTVWPPSACTNASTDSLPGAAVSGVTTTIVPETAGGGKKAGIERIHGVPSDTIVLPGLDASTVLTFGDHSFADLVSRADRVINSDYTFNDTQPSETGGVCNRNNPSNWGAPDDPGHPCFNYFPVIYVNGILTLQGSGSAQGILLVEKSLNINGPYGFHGIVIVKGNLQMSGQADLYGGTIVGGNLDLSGSSPAIHLSQCAISRALRLSSLTKPRLISPRAWVELF